MNADEAQKKWKFPKQKQKQLKQKNISMYEHVH